MRGSMPLPLFASCLPGLEPLCADELAALGATPRIVAGGVEFEGDADLLRRCHLFLGTASHVLVRAATFRCLALRELERKLAALPWREWLAAGTRVEVSATAKKSRLYHSGAIEERVLAAIEAALGTAPPKPPAPVVPLTPQQKKKMPLTAAAKRGRGPYARNPDPKYAAQRAAQEAKALAEAKAQEEAYAKELAERIANGPPPVPVAVRFVDDVATISIDTSATPLHRRGYRLDGSKAPLREDLAFAMLKAAGFARGTALFDPFCGSGTIAIEAAAIAAGLAPGRLRPAPLQGTAFADDAAWKKLLANQPKNPTGPVEGSPIAASDRDAGAIEACVQNASRAGVASAIDFRCAPLTKAPWFAEPETAPRALLVATNPPFGRRVGAGADLGPLYQTLGHRLARIDGARLAILAHDLRLARRTSRPLEVAFATRHGGLGVSLLVDAEPEVG